MKWGKPIVVKEAITPPILRNNIKTVKKKEKLQVSKIKIDKSSSNKSEKGKSLDKSRSTKIIETEDTFKTVNKSRSVSSARVSLKSIKIENPNEIDISKYNSNLSGISGHEESLSIVTPDQHRIHCRNKRKKTSDTVITGKKISQEPDNPSKRSKEDIITDVETLV